CVVYLDVALLVIFVVGYHGAIILVEPECNIPVQQSIPRRNGIDYFTVLHGDRKLLWRSVALLPSDQVLAPSIADVAVGIGIRIHSPNPDQMKVTIRAANRSAHIRIGF